MDLISLNTRCPRKAAKSNDSVGEEVSPGLARIETLGAVVVAERCDLIVVLVEVRA